MFEPCRVVGYTVLRFIMTYIIYLYYVISVKDLQIKRGKESNGVCSGLNGGAWLQGPPNLRQASQTTLMLGALTGVTMIRPTNKGRSVILTPS